MSLLPEEKSIVSSICNAMWWLRNSGLHITEARKKIMEAFLTGQMALTHDDINKFCAYQFDRVTIYRTLSLFVQCNIIHALPSSDNVIRYALLVADNGAALHRHHLHFICEDCHQTICLNNLPTPSLPLPEGFAVRQTEVVLKGTCQHCLSHQKTKHESI